MVKLADVLLSTSTIKWKEVDSSRSFQYIDLTSVDRSAHKISHTTNITSLNAPGRAQKLIQTDDVLFGTTRPTLNRLCIVDETHDKQICSTGLCVLRADTQKIIPGYIYYLLTTPKFVNYVEATQRGTSYPAITDRDVKEFQFELPSINEQQRIVDKLDVTFDEVNQALELTRRNIKNSHTLFSNLINAQIKENQNYQTLPLGATCEFVRGPFGGSLKKDIFRSSGYAVYEQRHAIYDNFSNVRYFIDETKFKEMKRFEVRPGDLIMSCSGTIGKIAIAPESLKPGIINQALLKFSPNRDKLSAQYLCNWIESTIFQEMLGFNTGGTAIKNIASVKILKELPISLPPMPVQEHTNDRIERLKRDQKQLINLMESKLLELSLLKQSMLNQSFSESAVK